MHLEKRILVTGGAGFLGSHPLVSLGSLPGLPRRQQHRSAPAQSPPGRRRDQSRPGAVMPRSSPECAVRGVGAAVTGQRRRRNADRSHAAGT